MFNKGHGRKIAQTLENNSLPVSGSAVKNSINSMFYMLSLDIAYTENGNYHFEIINLPTGMNPNNYYYFVTGVQPKTSWSHDIKSCVVYYNSSTSLTLEITATVNQTYTVGILLIKKSII